MRVANIVMAALFLFGAIVQFNDPDAALWIIVYLVATGVCLLAVRRPAEPVRALLLGVICLVWAASLSPEVMGRVPFGDMFGAWEMKDIGIERSREMYGLVLIAAWMAVIAIHGFRLRAASKDL